MQIGVELILLGTTSDNLTFAGCSRSEGTASGVAHSDGDQVNSLDHWYEQGSAEGSGDIFIMPTQRTNYTSIIKREPYCSRTANVQPRYGRDGTEYDYQAGYQTKLAFQHLENRLVWGYPEAPSTGATSGKTKGIYEYIQGNGTSAGGLDLDMEDVRAWERANASFGASPMEPVIALTPLYTAGVINSWGQAYVTRQTAPTEVAEMVIGSKVKMLNVGGRDILIVPYSKLTSEMFFLNPAKLGVGPLSGSAMTHTFYGKKGDRIKGEVLGEYTFAVMNAAAQDHKVIYGLKKS